MKKSVAIIALAFGVTSAFAQDLTSKKGEPILPEAGDYGIGIDANPFLEYMGNFFGKTSSNTAPTFNFLGGSSNPQVITGKYFKTAQMAYRASLRIGLGSTTQRAMVNDLTYVPGATNNYPNQDPQKENAWKHSTTNIALSVGMEKRKGKTRLQGYYGAEAGIGFSSSKDKFTYGNTLNPTGNPPVLVTSADDFGSSANNVITIPVNGVNGSARVTERKNGSVFSIGARAFVGVEYFILPKISLGGEFGWGLAISAQGKSTTKTESTGNTGAGGNDIVGSTTITGAKGGSFKLDTDNLNSMFGPTASIRLNFHF